jgi:hypothetical protein
LVLLDDKAKTQNLTPLIHPQIATAHLQVKRLTLERIHGMNCCFFLSADYANFEIF